METAMKIDLIALKKTEEQIERTGFDIEAMPIIKRFMDKDYRYRFFDVFDNIETAGIALKDNYTFRIYGKMKLIRSVWKFYFENTAGQAQKRESAKKAMDLVGNHFGLGYRDIEKIYS